MSTFSLFLGGIRQIKSLAFKFKNSIIWSSTLKMIITKTKGLLKWQ